MAKYEVEHRGLLTEKKYQELKTFFEKNGQFVGEKKRFSLVYSTAKKSVREVSDSKIDLKLRITNKRPEIALKYGKWSGKDARKEFNFHLEEDKFWEYAEFLSILGYKNYVLMANIKLDYLYNGIEFSLVTVPEWGYYFEAEILTDKKDIESANNKIDVELAKFGLKALGEEEFFDLLDDLNNRPGFRIELNDKTIQSIKRKFSEYL